MDESAECVHTIIHNDDMAENDYYLVQSDKWEGKWDGKADWARFPAECSQTFDFGERTASVTIKTWRCRPDLEDPQLSVYQDCGSQKRRLLVCRQLTFIIVHKIIIMYKCANFNVNVNFTGFK